MPRVSTLVMSIVASVAVAGAGCFARAGTEPPAASSGVATEGPVSSPAPSSVDAAVGSPEASTAATAVASPPDVPPTASPTPGEAAAAVEPRAARGGEELEEIIVTAQKRPENLQEIPFSMTTVDGETFEHLRSGGLDIQLMSARLPSLTVESSFGRTFPRFYIRGLGNTDFDLNASQPVSMILDDVVLENPTLKGFPIFDLDRVEVLRGPQGTLFGRNTPAGIVKFESRRPSQRPEAYADLTYGQYNFVGLEGAAGGPLVKDVLAARASVLFERRDDWVANDFTGNGNGLEGFQDAAGRLQLLFTPSDRFHALVNVHAHKLDGTARVFRANIIEAGTGKLLSDFDRTVVFQDGQNRQEITQLGGMLNLGYDLGPVTLTSVSGYENIDVYSRGDIDGGYGAAFLPDSGPGSIPYPSESADGIPSAYQLTEEVRLASDGWKMVNFQAGAFYFKELLHIDSFSYDTLAGGVENGYAKQRQDARAFGLFGTLTADLTDELRLSGGLRYNDDRKDFSAERITSPIGAGPIGPLTASPSDRFVSWDASATYDLTTDVRVFARAARGFRAPSVQGRLTFGDAISVADSEKVLSFDGGVKTELFQKRARVNLSGFYYVVSDQQLTAVGGTANFNTLLNADRSIGYGFEADTELMPLPRMFVTFGLSYNHTEIRDEDLAVAGCGGGCTVTDPAGPTAGTFLIYGNPLPHSPEWIADLTLRYGMPVGDSGELFLFTDWAYRSRINFFLYESKEFQDANLLEGSLRVGYSYDDGRWELAAFAHNITNDTSLVGGIDFNNLTGFVNEPRFIGLEGRYRL